MFQPTGSHVARGIEQAPDQEAWVLWRQDDNGSQFVVARFRSREAAGQAANAFESRRHKQTYWVSPEDETSHG